MLNKTVHFWYLTFLFLLLLATMEQSKTDQLISDELSKLGYTTIRPNQRKAVEAYI